jgi:hypothetical protein
MSGSTVKLTQPVTAHGSEVDELTLREPTVADQMELGSPFLIHTGDGDTAVEIRPKVVGAYVSRLAAIPMSSVKAMALADFSAVQAVVLGFFGSTVAEKLPS